MFAIRDVASLHDITPENARQWSLEFADYLSHGANPGAGKKRQFSPEDMEVFDLVAKAKARGLTFEEIHASLRNGQRGDAPQIAPQDIQALATVEDEKRLQVHVEYLNKLLVVRNDELQQVRGELAAARKTLEEYARVQAKAEYLEQDRQELQARVRELSSKIEDLSERVGREYAKGFIDALERQGNVGKRSNDET